MKNAPLGRISSPSGQDGIGTKGQLRSCPYHTIHSENLFPRSPQKTLPPPLAIPLGHPYQDGGEQCRAGGETHFTIHCAGQACHHQAVMAFDQLGLPDGTIFVDIPRCRRFVCTSCHGRNARVMPIFPKARGTPGYAPEDRNRSSGV